MDTAKYDIRASAARFDYPFFKNSDIQAEIAINGFSVQPLLNETEVQQLKDDFYNLLDLLKQPLPDTHWSSGRVNDVSLRNFARQSIDAVVPGKLQRYFDTETTDFVGGIYLAKRSSAKSELTAHQDSSHTDETKFPAVYAWVPLVDTTVRNGAMHILPGSQLWGNRYRSLNVPWLFSGLESIMQPHLWPVEMKAGDVLFFDSAAIHYSSNNMESTTRPAINYFVKPKEALFLHHFIAENTPKGDIEVYNVDIDFFYNYDFLQRPPCPPYFQLPNEKYNLGKPSAADIHTLITTLSPGSVSIK